MTQKKNNLLTLIISAGNQLREIQRQNRITQQIVQNYLERKLFPYRRPRQQVPSIDEILPLTTEAPIKYNKQQEVKDDDDLLRDEDQDFKEYYDPETLQSVESEHYDSIYGDDQGRSLGVYLFINLLIRCRFFFYKFYLISKHIS